jgi:hypothetical protein
LSDNFQMEFTKGKVQPALRTQLTHLLTDFQVDLQRGCFHFSVQCRFSNGYIIQDTFIWDAFRYSDGFTVLCNFQMTFRWTLRNQMYILRTQVTHFVNDFQVDLHRGCFHISDAYRLPGTFRWDVVKYSDGNTVLCTFQMTFTRA